MLMKHFFCDVGGKGNMWNELFIKTICIDNHFNFGLYF